jgi:hypothetical protein
MKFGILKSKIEGKLLEAYRLGNFDVELKKFKKLVLENKKISNLFFLYDELSSNKGLKTTEKANDFINESIKLYENNINKITTNEINRIKNWVSDYNVKNEYEDVDNLFRNDVLAIESKIDSRKKLVESLVRETKINTSQINLPIKTLVNVANSTINKYIEQLDEETKKELNELFSTETNLEEKYVSIKNEVITKLNNLKETSDTETFNKINESIEKITNEKFDKLNLYRLKTLNESL